MIDTTARNATLADLATLLTDQQARKLDIVVPATKLRSEGGVLVVEGAEGQLTDDGVLTVDGRYRPTDICDEGVSEKLGIPLAYVRRMRTERPDLYDANVNGWLRGYMGQSNAVAATIADGQGEPDPRSFLLRCFRGDDPGSEGIARALLSDRFARIDHLDIVTAALDGIRQADVDAQVIGCDLTERRMQVRVVAPAIQTTAERLLAEYRSPFRDPALDQQRQHGGGAVAAAVAAMQTWGRHSGPISDADAVVFAGFVISNSETGGGAFTITPRVVFRVCNNGATLTADALRSVHVGGKLDEGVIRWTEDTQRKAVQLVTAKTRDAVQTFLSEEFLVQCVTGIEEKAGAPVTRPVETIEKLGKALTYDAATIAGVLEHFTRGGQMTAGGVLNAVTSYAQLVPDADKAAELEASAIRALEFTAALTLA